MNTILTLLKREYWENRSGFAITPIAIGGFFIVVFLMALFNTEHLFGTHGASVGPINIRGVDVSGLDFLGGLTVEFANLALEKRQKIWEMGFYGISSPFTVVMLIISTIYLLGSLYDDRKDRSILFWKSLPVSDLLTVTSKVITVILVIPALFIAATTVTYISIMIISTIVALFSSGNIWESIWQPAPFITAPIKLYFSFVIQSLWAAPVLGWFLLVSSWTKRKPILVASIPVGMIAFLEFYFYRSSVFIDAFRERAMGWAAPIDILSGRHLGAGEIVSDQSIIYGNAHTLLSLPEFWYGLVVAAAMFASAVYIRRYRDES